MTDSVSTPNRLHRAASSIDVAAYAGVSTQTVSRVARGSTKVGASTRARVLAAMEELGYRPNRTARALRSGQYRSIGVIVFGLSTIGNVRTLEALTRVGREAGYSINLVTTEGPTQAEVTAAFERMRQEVVDGVLIVIDRHLPHGMAELPPLVPVVVIDSDRRPDHPVIDTEQAEGAGLATQHLLDLGHPTVWHVAGPVSSYAAQHRENGWRATLESAGRPVPELARGDWSSASGYAAGRSLAASDATAVFVANDQMALGLMRAMHEAGRQVPEDVSVVGFDDMAEAADFWPPLTTIRQDFDAVARTAVQRLIAEIEGQDSLPEALNIPTVLVRRASTAPAR